jgi:hypothetical protein
MSLEETRASRRNAGENLLAAWGLAIIPNMLDAFGVNLPDEWWWYVIRFGLSALWLAALIAWLKWLWRERQAKRAVNATSCSAQVGHPALPRPRDGSYALRMSSRSSGLSFGRTLGLHGARARPHGKPTQA